VHCGITAWQAAVHMSAQAVQAMSTLILKLQLDYAVQAMPTLI
jgi:hypothetical protein